MNETLFVSVVFSVACSKDKHHTLLPFPVRQDSLQMGIVNLWYCGVKTVDEKSYFIWFGVCVVL